MARSSRPHRNRSGYTKSIVTVTSWLPASIRLNRAVRVRARLFNSMTPPMSRALPETVRREGDPMAAFRVFLPKAASLLSPPMHRTELCTDPDFGGPGRRAFPSFNGIGSR